MNTRPSTPEEYEALAEECRRTASGTTDPFRIRSLIDQASELEAKATELRGRHGHGSY
jgi:hypothetical protein